MSALVTMSNVWNSGGNKECLGKGYIVMALLYVETCVTLIYIWSIPEAREFQSSFPHRASLLGSGPSVGKNVQMAPIVDPSIHC